MDVRIYDLEKAVTNKKEDMQFVADFNVTMYKDFDFGGFVEIDGKVYVMCMYDGPKDILAVKKLERFEASPNAITARYYTCPYCKTIELDVWELSEDEEEHYCGQCGSNLKYRRNRSVHDALDYTYTVEPLKMADYTKLG